MSDGKVKIYKNKERGKTEVRKASYVPQYQLMGMEPEEAKTGPATSGTRVSTSVVIQEPQTNDNPRTRRVGIRQPYAEPLPSPIGRNKGPVPNVGNNMEHTWSSVDGEIIDDLSDLVAFQDRDQNQPMIDNNDYISDEALGLPHEELPALDEVRTPPSKKFTAAAPEEDDVVSVLHNLSEGDYLLMVNGVSVCSGAAEQVQEQARLLVFGEHDLCDGNPIPVDDIIVIKRVPIRVGLFLE